DGRRPAARLRDAARPAGPSPLPHDAAGGGVVRHALPLPRAHDVSRQVPGDGVDAALRRAEPRPADARARARAAGAALAAGYPRRMRVRNLLTLALEADDHPTGHRFSATSLTEEFGATATGLGVYEIEPGNASWPYHFEVVEEEWLIVIEGELTLL